MIVRVGSMNRVKRAAVEEEGCAKKEEPAEPSTSGSGSAPEPKKPATGHKRHASSQAVEKATDDYCLERFKKNMRHGRHSKIKIA